MVTTVKRAINVIILIGIFECIEIQLRHPRTGSPVATPPAPSRHPRDSRLPSVVILSHLLASLESRPFPTYEARVEFRLDATQMTAPGSKTKGESGDSDSLTLGP